MMFKFYLFGTPNDRHEQFPYNEHSKQFQQFAQYRIGNSQLIIYRSKNEIYYAYVRNLSENGDAYFGVCLIFEKNIHCHNITKLYRLLDAVYNEVILKNGILLKEVNGQVVFANTNKLESENEIKNIESIICKNINTKFGKNDFKEDKNFEQGNKQVILQKVSVAKGNKYILEKVKEFPLLVVFPKNKQEKKTTSFYKLKGSETDISENNNQSKTVVKISEQSKEKTAQEQNNNQEIPKNNLIQNSEKTMFTLCNKILLCIAILGTIAAIISIYKIISVWVE